MSLGQRKFEFSEQLQLFWNGVGLKV